MNNKLSSLLNFLFPCPHRKLTFPLSIKDKNVSPYRRCLDCGKKFPYSGPGAPDIPAEKPAPPVQLKEAVHA